MTPDERAFYQAFGEGQQTNVSLVAVALLLQGILVGLFSYSTNVFMQRGLAGWPRKIMFTTNVLSFLLSWIPIIELIAYIVRETTGILFDLSSADEVSAGLMVYGLIGDWASQISLILNDAVVIWRAWVLSYDQRWIMLGPCFLMAGTIGVSVAYFVVDTNLVAFLDTYYAPYSLVNLLSHTSLALSLATNALTTLLIFYKLWTHQRFMRRITMRNSLTASQKTMLMLVESGFVFCFLQMIAMIVIFLPDNSTLSTMISTIIIYIFYGALPMFPAVIILFVNKQSTMAETYGFITDIMSSTGSEDVERKACPPATETSQTTGAEVTLGSAYTDSNI